VEKLELEGDEAIGGRILRRALEEPLRQIANNSGHEGAVVLEKVRQTSEANFGLTPKRKRTRIWWLQGSSIRPR
jgi:chaperonin GroEL